MRVLILHPSQRVHPNYIDYPAFESLAAWNVADYLKIKGHDVSLIDAYCLPASDWKREPEHIRIGVTQNRLLEEIQNRANEQPAEVAIVQLGPFAVQAPDDDNLFFLIRALRQAHPSVTVVLADLHIGGMNYVAYDPSRFLSSPGRPDILLRYEAEVELEKLLTALENDRNISKKVIDGVPLSGPLQGDGGYALVDLDAYRELLSRMLQQEQRPNPFAVNTATLPFKSSRGCCFSCSFCTSHPAHASGARREWRPLSPEALERQLSWLSERPGVEKLLVLDEAANIGRDHFDRLLQLAYKAGLKLEFPNGLRADLLTQNQIERLAELISLLSLSPESGAATVLSRIIGKQQSLEAVELATQQAYKARLPVALHFIVGLPGESRQEIGQTFAFATRMYERYGARPWMQFAVALPGTRLFEQCQEKGLLPDPLPRDFGPVFQGTPMLKDGTCAVSNAELQRLKHALDCRIRE